MVDVNAKIVDELDVTSECDESVEEEELNDTLNDASVSAFNDLCIADAEPGKMIFKPKIINLFIEVLAYISCAAHNIQLVLKDGLKLDEAMTILIDRVSKDIVSKSKFSSFVAEELLKFRKKFAKRVITRWNSILFMIRCVLKVSNVEFATIRSKMPKKTLKQRSARDKFVNSDTDR
jgi:hypothetical protein